MPVRHGRALVPSPYIPGRQGVAGTAPWVDLRDYMRDGDEAGTRVVTQDFQDALDAAAGGTLYVPTGTWLVDAPAGNRCLTWRFPCHIMGDGMTQSVIAVKAGTRATADVLRVDPDPTAVGEDEFGWIIEGIRIKSESGNAGRYAFNIHLRDSAATFLARMRISDCWFGETNSRAFSMTKDGSTLNGWFTSVVEGSRFDGGPDADAAVYLDRSGDSLLFQGCTITGDGVGIYTAPVSGAAQQVFADCNITASGGAFYISGGTQVKIIRCQMEQSSAYTGDDDAMVVLDSTSEALICDSNMNAHSRVSNVLITGTSARCRIYNNVMTGVVIASDSHFVIGANAAASNDISNNTFFTSAGAVQYYPTVSNSATTTQIGVWYPLTLQNSWVNGGGVNFISGIQAMKTADGFVHLRGHVEGGTSTAGTTIAGPLPVGMRPTTLAIRIMPFVSNAGTWRDELCNVDADGNIKIAVDFAGNTTAMFDGLSFHTFPSP